MSVVQERTRPDVTAKNNAKKKRVVPVKKKKKKKNPDVNDPVPDLIIDEHYCGWMQRNALVGILGRRRSGKSYCLRQIAYEMQFSRIAGFAGGYDSGKMISTYVPDTYVHYGFDASKVHAIMVDQEQVHIRGEMDPSVDTDCAMFLDDLAYERKIMYSKALGELAKNGRHISMFVAITAQYCFDMPPGVRGQLDYLFVYKEMTHDNRRKMFKAYFGVFPDYDVFNDVLVATTAEHHCLVLDTSSKSSKVENSIFYFKATFELPKFTLGDPIFIAYHEMYYKNPRAQALQEAQAKTVDTRLQKVIDARLAKQKLRQDNMPKRRQRDDNESESHLPLVHVIKRPRERAESEQILPSKEQKLIARLEETTEQLERQTAEETHRTEDLTQIFDDLKRQAKDQAEVIAEAEGKAKDLLARIDERNLRSATKRSELVRLNKRRKFQERVEAEMAADEEQFRRLVKRHNERQDAIYFRPDQDDTFDLVSAMLSNGIF